MWWPCECCTETGICPDDAGTDPGPTVTDTFDSTLNANWFVQCGILGCTVEVSGGRMVQRTPGSGSSGIAGAHREMEGGGNSTGFIARIEADHYLGNWAQADNKAWVWIKAFEEPASQFGNWQFVFGAGYRMENTLIEANINFFWWDGAMYQENKHNLTPADGDTYKIEIEQTATDWLYRGFRNGGTLDTESQPIAVPTPICRIEGLLQSETRNGILPKPTPNVIFGEFDNYTLSDISV